jgi:hypothetical protein
VRHVEASRRLDTAPSIILITRSQVIRVPIHPRPWLEAFPPEMPGLVVASGVQYHELTKWLLDQNQALSPEKLTMLSLFWQTCKSWFGP